MAEKLKPFWYTNSCLCISYYHVAGQISCQFAFSTVELFNNPSRPTPSYLHVIDMKIVHDLCRLNLILNMAGLEMNGHLSLLLGWVSAGLDPRAPSPSPHGCAADPVCRAPRRLLHTSAQPVRSAARPAAYSQGCAAGPVCRVRRRLLQTGDAEKVLLYTRVLHTRVEKATACAS